MGEDNSPSGFRSHRAHRSLRLWVWGLGIPLGIVQLVIPVASVVWIVVVVIAAAFKSSTVDVSRAVVHDDRVWVPRTEPGNKFGRDWGLVAFGTDEGIAVRTIQLPQDLSELSAPWLLPDDDGLLVLRGPHRGVIRDAVVEMGTQGPSFRPASRVFHFRERPAILERDDRALRIKTWGSSKWTDAGALGLELPEGSYPDDLVVVIEEPTIHVFMQDSDGDILHGEGNLKQDQHRSFRKVSASEWGFAAGLHGDKLHILRVVEERESRRVEALRQRGDGWQPVAKLPLEGARDLHWLTLDSKAVLVTESGLGGIQLLEFDGASLVKGRSVGDETGTVLFWALLPQGASVVLAILFAGIVAVLMRTRRERMVEGLELAPLGKRAMARAVDTLLMILPIILAFAWALTTGQIQSVMSTGAQAGYVAWALLLTGLFSVSEGHFGVTPGKALLGIRVVGTDGQVCGFGRGVARNLLLVIDGMLMYQVGVMTIALSPQQQRVGDMASKTLVVERVKAG